MKPFGLKTSIAGAALGLALAAALPQAAAAAPENFPTPQAAADAVVAALEAKDRDKLLAIFGPESEDVIFTGEDAKDRENWGEFLRDYKSTHEITTDDDGTTATLSIGPDLWPFPASIVKDDKGWHFDAESAREEVLARRIGENELDVIDLLHGYVQAQAKYRSRGSGGRRAPHLRRRDHQRRGQARRPLLAERAERAESPIGDFMARAAADGYNVDGTDQNPEPYLGYYYRVLTRQGPDAPGGAMDYMVDGHMVAGHALIAFPADYGDTGVMTFIVGEDDVVYEKDLGEDTLNLAAAIDSFDPGDGWEPVAAVGIGVAVEAAGDRAVELAERDRLRDVVVHPGGDDSGRGRRHGVRGQGDDRDARACRPRARGCARVAAGRPSPASGRPSGPGRSRSPPSAASASRAVADHRALCAAHARRRPRGPAGSRDCPRRGGCAPAAAPAARRRRRPPASSAPRRRRRRSGQRRSGRCCRAPARSRP